MIKIPEISTFKKEFYGVIKPLFFTAISNMKLCSTHGNHKYDSFIHYITGISGDIDETRLFDLVCGNEASLKSVISLLGEMKAIRKTKKNPAVRYEIFEKLYDDFIKTDFGKTWALKIGIKTCPYCNRSFIFTIKSKNVRPEYDHFFPKSIFPYLCVSMYNLIPTCKNCNQAKHNHNTFKKPIIYPFEDEFGHDIRFTLKPQLGVVELFEGQYYVDFLYNSTNTSINDKAKESAELLHLIELYNLHKDYINNIIKLRIIYSDDYIKSLFDTFSYLFDDSNELKNTLFLSRLSKEAWGEVILSKLTSDIIDFIDGY